MSSEKEQVALGSIAASAVLTAAKGVVGVLTGSLAIQSEAAHSLLDLAATIMTYFAVRISGKPADEAHHYGHGQGESESARPLLDLAPTIMTYFAVRISGKPADEEHHYGHGKVESVSALIETALLFLLSGAVIWEALHR